MTVLATIFSAVVIIAAIVIGILVAKAPTGYEDESGFHMGVKK